MTSLAPGRMEATPGEPPTWFQTLTAPLLALIRPSLAGALLARARVLPFVVTVLLYTLIFAHLLVGLILWEQTLQYVWFITGPQVQMRTVAEVWAEWRATALLGWISPAEITVGVTLVLAPLALAILGWVNLPLVYVHGSVAACSWRTFRAGGALLFVGTVAIIGAGVGITFLSHEEVAGGIGAEAPTLYVLLFSFALPTAGALWIALVARRCIYRLESRAPLPLPPCCEGCGYDLTHLPANARCTECGLRLADSLDERCRPGTPWAQRRTPLNWLRTAWSVFWQPRRFYRQLRLRADDGAARRFALWTYPLRVLAAYAFIAVGIMIHGERDPTWSVSNNPQEVAAMAAVVINGTLVWWAAHRTLGALLSMWPLLFRQIRDFRWVAQVIAYETVFLFAFAVCWGLLALSYAAFGDWISNLFDLFGGAPFVRRPFGVPYEVSAMFGMSAVLGLVWLFRYLTAYRSIRWSNF